MYLILSFSSSAHRWTHFPCTSTNPVGSTHRVQQNCAVAGFKDDCVGERFCDFWQSRGGELHVFCTFRAAWRHQRNSNAPWWVTPNCCTTPSGKPQAGKYLITLLGCTHLQYTRIAVAFVRYIVLTPLKVKKIIIIRPCPHVSEIRVHTKRIWIFFASPHKNAKMIEIR